MAWIFGVNQKSLVPQFVDKYDKAQRGAPGPGYDSAAAQQKGECNEAARQWQDAGQKRTEMRHAD
eukprot:scaffold1332_cov137-Skeletonema_menzelii.AAC.10